MKIEIAGRGNVATHMEKALRMAGHDARMLDPHTLDGLAGDANLLLICVSDRAIREVAEKAARLGVSENCIIAHTSGSTPLSVLDGTARHTGVFYPMQTFSKEVALYYSEIPFFIEGSDEETETKLMALAAGISRSVRRCDSTKRKMMHISSVFCCNFSNHLWAVADEYLRDNGLDFKDMIPLLRETLRKASENRPGDVQTGPAARGDRKVIEEHERELASRPRMQRLYRLLSESIGESVGKN